MRRFIRPRLRKPLMRAIGGTVLAGAWAIGSPHWWLAIAIEITALGYAATWYVWAGQDTDEGALLGSRADERQRLVGQQAGSLAGKVSLAGAYVGLVVMLAVKPDDAWPFAALLVVAGFGYIFGLSLYGSGEPDSTDDAEAGDQAPSRISC